MFLPMKTHPPLLLLGLLAMAAASAPAQTVTTSPVGFISVTAKGDSDTILAAPLHQLPAFAGTVASFSGDTLTFTSAAFTPDSFNNQYYVLIGSGGSGAREGMWYKILDTLETTLKIDLNGDPLNNQMVSGASIRVIPFWTLNTVFPEGAGVHASPTFRPNSRILIPDGSTSGVNLASTASYFYYSGTASGGEGWRKFNASPSEKFDALILPPASHFIIRHELPQDTIVNNLGAVQMASLTSIVRTLTPNQTQDNSLAFNVAVPTSLADSKLYESGAFMGTSNFNTLADADLLLVFDNSVIAKNKAPSAIYFYYTGADNGGAGWRKQGDPVTTIHNTTQAFQPATGCILRKAATGSAQSAIWQARPSYVPQ